MEPGRAVENVLPLKDGEQSIRYNDGIFSNEGEVDLDEQDEQIRER